MESVEELIQFVVHVNATNMFTMTYSPADSPFDDPLTYVEAIFPDPGPNVICVCLLPVAGWPFISSLELRPLNSTMYTYSGNVRQYLVNLVRWNPGAPSGFPLVRFPADVYDRFWYPANASNIISDFTCLSSSPPPDTTIRGEVNSVPPKVMQDAYTAFPYAFNDSLLTYWTLFVSGPMSLPQVGYVYVALYTENLRNSEGLGMMTVSIDDDSVSASVSVVNVSNQASMAVIPNYVLAWPGISITFKNNVSSHGNSVVAINAIEVYGQYNFNFSKTVPADEGIITALKTSFDLTDWQGDPCMPVPYDWVSCMNFDDPMNLQGQEFFSTTYYISTINLSKLPTRGFTVLQDSRFSYLGLEYLNKLSITESKVNGSIFNQLITGFVGPSLQVLDFSNNAIERLPAEWPNLANNYSLPRLTSLNLSHNLLTGPFQVNWSTLSGMQELDLSYNGITSFPIPYTSYEMGTLVILDLSCNQLVDDISALNVVVEKNALSLQNLFVSNNRLTGIFPSTLYFSALLNLTIVNFDGNAIEGTLDLSLWLNALEDDISTNSTQMIQKLFSFVNNSISNIYPSANAMESTISRLQNRTEDFNTGILLGGNPYCRGAESEIQQYLCRPQEYTKKNIDEQERDTRIISTTVGTFALLLFVVTIATMWKLWKQVYDLRKVQQALAAQQVQPPFYQYSDLKSATRNFHQDNKLGHGSFGEVYKGILPDETSVAVKKLFNSQNLQVLNEFLNEVVLITGIKHRNLVQLKGCCIRDKQRMLVYEHVEKGNLAQALWGSRTLAALNWEQRFNICMGVARGLSYLHEELQPSIIHRDIKPENILLDRNINAKIADFGLATHLLDESSHKLYTKIAGTLGYFAPEYATQGQLSEKADVYSYGIVVLEVVSGRKCIDHSLPERQVFLKNWVHAMHKTGMLIDVLDAKLRDSCLTTEVIRTIKIGLLCSQTDRERRPSMSQVVTMFLGTMDVEISLEEAVDSQSQFENLLVSTDSQMESSTLETTIEEESSAAPLMTSGSESSFKSTQSSVDIQMSV